MKCVLGFLLLVMLVLYPVTAEQTITAIYSVGILFELY